jgi:hypothetical protein
MQRQLLDMERCDYNARGYGEHRDRQKRGDDDIGRNFGTVTVRSQGLWLH